MIPRELTTVVNAHVDACDVIVDRSGPFGNPHVPRSASFQARLDAIAAFQETFERRLRADAAFRAAVVALRGKVLGCHCVPKPCHAAIIAGWLNGDLIFEGVAPPW